VQHFAQISDPHLSSLEGVRARDLLSQRALGYLSWSRRRRFEHRPEVLDALKRDLDQLDFDLDQLLVTGDLTHVGLPQEFHQALAWLRDLGAPGDVAVIPGNHDASVATPWPDTFALWRDYMASDAASGAADSLATLYPSLRTRGDIAFIGLSTACPKPPLMATGTVGADQLARLPALLDAAHARAQFRVVYLHHSPLPGLEKWRKRLTDAAEVQAVIAQHGAELVLNGHGHRSQYAELDTAHGLAPVIAIPSASSLGLHSGRPASYNCYGVEKCEGGWHLTVDARDYQPDSGEFTAGESKSIELARTQR
jgi:3',5'-cyclic AMP phosphodiesterase CpdA